MTTVLHLTLDGDGVFPDLAQRVVHEAIKSTIVGLSGGMASGLPSVTIRLDLPNGEVAIAQTSLRLFLQATDALAVRYIGEQRGAS